MKKLLSMLAVSTLSVTSASNLKPVFTSNVSQGFKSSEENNKDITISGENDTNPFITPLILKEKMVSSTIISLPNGVIYVGTKNEGLWKSIDGINIEQLTKGIPNNLYIKSLTVAPNGTVYVGTLGNGLYKIKNDGSFEQVVNEIPNKSNITSLSVSSAGVIYVGSSDSTESLKSVYKSTDNGTTFLPMSGTTGTIYSLAVDSNNNIYAGTMDYGSYDGYVYKSTDNGTTFLPMSGTSRAVQSLAVDSNNNIYAGTIAGLYSSNGFNPFIEENEVSTDNVVNSVYVAPNGVIYVGTQNKGLYTINPINLLLNINTDGFYADEKTYKYGGAVYNSAQKIDIKDKLVASATFDTKNITIPTTNLDLTNGQLYLNTNQWSLKLLQNY